MKLLRWIDENVLLCATLILLAFIPLYPKLPIFGINHTWVYVRLDDFLVGIAVLLYGFELYRKKASWKTPLTMAIIAFWVIGLTATVLGIVILFPSLSGVFPHIAILYYLRHIEYLSVFFIAFAALKEKKHVTLVMIFLLTTFFAVLFYGLGQRFIPCYFPAFSTMNEEFAKGIPLCLNASDRLQSTFAGHYDFAAYLVMMIPIVGSLLFGIKKWWQRIGLLLLALVGVFELLMTASRTSFAMYLFAVCVMLVLQKQKKWILPVILVSGLMLYSFQGLYGRYLGTVSSHPLVYDMKGNLIGIGQKNKDNTITVDKQTNLGPKLQPGTQPITHGDIISTASAIDVKTTTASQSAPTTTHVQGEFVIKQQQTLDISLTTRLQAEWPNAIKAWLRDPLFGSGYSTITLATDGNYFRILGETGILGLVSFLAIFFLYMRYVYQKQSVIQSPLVKSLQLGIVAGVSGLLLNAILIDVFEASKIAYMLWLLVGISLGILKLYTSRSVSKT